MPPVNTGSDAALTWLRISFSRLLHVSHRFNRICANAQNLSTAGTDLVSGAVDSIINLSRLPTASSQTTLNLHKRAHRICILARSCTTSSSRADCLRCISAASYNSAAAGWRTGKMAGAMNLAKQSCDIGTDALDLVRDDEEAREASGMRSLAEAMPKRFELVAACAIKLLDRKVSYLHQSRRRLLM